MNATTTPDTALHILIAEDSATQAQRLQHILEQHGYRVHSHGEEGSLSKPHNAANLRSSSAT